MEVNETVNQGTTAAEPERTFTQAEMDAVVGDRLKRERAKYSDYEDLKLKAEQFDALKESQKSELQKATEKAAALQAKIDALEAAETMRTMRADVSAKTGVPADILTGSTQEECEAQAKQILAFASSRPGYPKVQDAGEIGGSAKPLKNREKFAEWFESLNN